MVSTLFLSSWLAAGQVPMPLPAAPMPPANIPVIKLADTPPMPMTNGTPAPAPAAAPPNGSGNGNGNGCSACEEKKEAEPAPATKYLIMKLLENSRAGQTLDCRGITLQGWVDMNYTPSSASKTNLPVTFNDRANEFQMNQAWFEAVKAIDTSKDEVQTGFRTSVFYGTDGRFTIPRGQFDNQLRNGRNGAPRNYVWDPVYHYGELYLPDLGGEGTTFRLGRFGTLIGYEVIDAVNTPFVSKSYNFQYNPFTHTGALATTQVTEDFMVYNGAALGNDVYIDPAARLQYLGGFKYAPTDGDTSVAVNTAVTNPRYFVREAVNHFNSYNLLITHKFSECVSYVADATFSHIYGVPGLGAGGGQGRAHWYGVANYLITKHSDKLTSTLRLEAFDDVRGYRTGFEGLYAAATYGLAWNLTDALIFRPAVRYDYNGYSRPFEGDHYLWTTAVELIARY